MVEFALASTVLFLLLLGLLDLGRVYYFGVSLQGAAREGARHGAWFNPGTDTNPYLDDNDILTAVNEALSPSSLDATFPTGYSGSTYCPTASDGNANNDPPFPSADYPTTVNQAWLYVCYKTSSGTSYTGGRASAPSAYDTSWEQGDVEVILLMSYGLITQFMQSYIGNSIHVVGYAHFEIQGSQP